MTRMHIVSLSDFIVISKNGVCSENVVWSLEPIHHHISFSLFHVIFNFCKFHQPLDSLYYYDRINTHFCVCMCVLCSCRQLNLKKVS